MSTPEFQVTGMTCAHCENAVATGRLLITSSASVDDAQVLAAVEEAGYTAVRIP